MAQALLAQRSVFTNVMDTFGLAEGHPEPISSKTRNIIIEVQTRCMPRDDTQVHDTYHNQEIKVYLRWKIQLKTAQ
jgi:hypothetical protein